ncbi:hypothetical protein FD05_GL001854 [Lentilactobacillus otakiensis DSM 19908 = JCM 15040]|uniref:CRISPR system CASCADE complex protein n=1 Tax=Lentilactobacillus otakiensis DSM 19908 = JCM 15040 TaxID=1423780 RepID=S4NMF0_9LACO|nr:type I-E CRISPR-associated protein Cas6/Cse3/CasE [Lentilactobacillus otakiensis]KRL12027.1 hypothetical protein FD05_GL001854 [Lentilactobacillus otakiensis DSM 19908 = JCM 15040]MBZ3776105.1 type I-E CRISPR-associated protein Cas6/Cse3/CasE [Lentilactobacillus otakiensis]MDV3517364.1 type I-E CRISPR-associated protein Cas6/Cse3/CasE [Lentilactobacillus otakiensis]GAD17061.1 CRISPR system CASCADE complex protein [Lentilactobacillus otakiensis DSM 19908 = JCM 15040]
MYLSRVEIDINNRQKTKELTHLGAYHNWVEQGFPNEIADHKRLRHLWRIDRLAGKTYLLVLSQEAPNLDQLGAYGVEKTAMTKSYDPFLDQVKEGQIMQFRLTANPTHAISQPGKNQPRIVPHVTVNQQRQWLAERAAKLGFQVVKTATAGLMDSEEIENFDIVSRDWPILKRGHRTIRLSRVTYEGLLRVDDLDTFKQTLMNGIGREKAFGMGLMTVIPRG